DLAIARGDGMPTYNVAVVVDDIDMRITHVLRGDDHVNNTPRQINIYRAILGPGVPLPQFGHLPMILGPDGQKLSKRHGTVSVLQYRDDGFLPEAVFNYLARLGWSHGDDEKFGRVQLAQWFDLAHVNRAPAQYNLDKLLWLNGEYMKEAADARLADLVAPRLERLGAVLAGPALVDVVALLKQRARTLNELADEAMLFYGPHGVSEALAAEHLRGAGAAAVRAFAARVDAVAWDKAALNALLKEIVGELGVKMPQVAVPIRVAVTGRAQTPSLDAVLHLFGRAAVQARLAAVLPRLP
ncbi:MAG: glutamate--tRNA ligase, partial [Betaproteobacteria bacterium]